MKMKPLKLFKFEEVGKDELGNSIKGPVLIEGNYKGAISQWTTEEIALLEREVTRTQRKLLTDAPLNVINQCERLEIGNETYSLIDVKSDFIRWRLCHVKEYFT